MTTTMFVIFWQNITYTRICFDDDVDGDDDDEDDDDDDR